MVFFLKDRSEGAVLRAHSEKQEKPCCGEMPRTPKGLAAGLWGATQRASGEDNRYPGIAGKWQDQDLHDKTNAHFLTCY